GGNAYVAARPKVRFLDAPQPAADIDIETDMMRQQGDGPSLATVGRNVVEFGKGIPSGAISLGGTALKGVAASRVGAERREFDLADALRNAREATPEEIAT